jgi:FHA domain
MEMFAGAGNAPLQMSMQQPQQQQQPEKQAFFPQQQSHPEDIPKYGFAKLQGVNNGLEYYIRKYEVLLGRSSKSSAADIILGDNMNISRQHAKISFNFDTGCFELTVMGKNGVTVQGSLYTPTSEPKQLKSQDLLQIGDCSFHFLLPKAGGTLPGVAIPKRRRGGRGRKPQGSHTLSGTPDAAGPVFQSGITSAAAPAPPRAQALQQFPQAGFGMLTAGQGAPLSAPPYGSMQQMPAMQQQYMQYGAGMGAGAGGADQMMVDEDEDNY